MLMKVKQYISKYITFLLLSDSCLSQYLIVFVINIIQMQETRFFFSLLEIAQVLFIKG